MSHCLVLIVAIDFGAYRVDCAFAVSRHKKYFTTASKFSRKRAAFSLNHLHKLLRLDVYYSFDQPTIDLVRIIIF